MENQSREINFIDPNWDHFGGKIQVRGRVYRLICVKGLRLGRVVQTDKALLIRDNIWVPKSVCYIYNHYRGCGDTDMMIYVLEGKWFNEKKEALKKLDLTRDFTDIGKSATRIQDALTEQYSYSTAQQRFKNAREDFFLNYMIYLESRDKLVAI